MQLCSASAASRELGACEQAVTALSKKPNFDRSSYSSSPAPGPGAALLVSYTASPHERVPLSRTSRWRFFAGAERYSRLTQAGINSRCERRAPPSTRRAVRSISLERRHGIAETVERGRLVVFVKRLSESFLILFVSLVRVPPPPRQV